MLTNTPRIFKFCMACKHYVPIGKGVYICGFDSKTYEVKLTELNEENLVARRCVNGGFEYDDAWRRGLRWWGWQIVGYNL